MDNGNIGGLAGRARKVRERNRSRRMHTRQLIEEYLDPAALPPTRRRQIPIRVRRDHTLTANRAAFDEWHRYEFPLRHKDDE